MEPEYGLNRFLEAQSQDYATALSEIRAGCKLSHWMWYIFPQAKGLGLTSVSQYYGIDGIGEAKAYLSNETLRQNLIEISEALLSLESSDAREILGTPDDLKLRSSMTLFLEADPGCVIFQKVLDKFFHGEKDEKTLLLL